MTSAPIAQAARPVLVHGLTQAMGDAFAPLVQKLAAVGPDPKQEYAAGEALTALIARRGQLLSNAIDQYAGGKPTEAADLARPRPTNSDNATMLTGPWQAALKELMGQNVGPEVAAPFGTFATASMQRAGLSGLPPRDMAILNNELLLLALGVASYWATGQATSTDPKVWASEAVDRSGIVDILTSGDHVIVDGGTLRKFGSASVSQAEAGRMHTLLMMHNLHYLRHLFDAAKHGLDNAFGIQPNR